MRQPKLLIVTGISGSGKTTAARSLIKRGEIAFDSKLNPGLYHFVDEDGKVATDIRLQDEAWRKQYKWSLHEEKLDDLLKEHRNAPRVFLCGRANLFQYWHKADKVLLLQVDAQTLLQRLNSPTRDNLFAKDDTTQQQLVNNLDSVQQKIIQKGGIIVNAEKSAESVTSQILEIIKS